VCGLIIFTCRVLGFVGGLILDRSSCGRGTAINLWGWDSSLSIPFRPGAGLARGRIRSQTGPPLRIELTLRFFADGRLGDESGASASDVSCS
jgi:hypothetical protein